MHHICTPSSPSTTSSVLFMSVDFEIGAVWFNFEAINKQNISITNNKWIIVYTWYLGLGEVRLYRWSQEGSLHRIGRSDIYSHARHWDKQSLLIKHDLTWFWFTRRFFGVWKPRFFIFSVVLTLWWNYISWWCLFLYWRWCWEVRGFHKMSYVTTIYNVIGTY